MSDGFPSMTALLGLLAVPGQAGLGGLLGNIGGALGGAGVGNVLGGGLGQMVESFRQNGHGAAADSWVNHGPTHEIASPQLRQAIGPDVMDALSRQTGLSHDELLSRLSRELPSAVDRYTPDGRLPAL
ncbi:YidB family protein [Methylobacterium sp. J-077]|uniref:YidB family protein n=1 Tax=Methylobacterium sp. J-077 TaxID=2836656 RepID=UPI001FB97E87|nr:YidB family protein [Methylobacterium sp. J-077]MCJ2124610.1 YidB family protein [Methylobacterium sp. J-077]